MPVVRTRRALLAGTASISAGATLGAILTGGEAMAAAYDGELARITVRRALAGTLVDVLDCPPGGWPGRRAAVPDDLTADAWAALMRIVDGLDGGRRLEGPDGGLSAMVGRPAVGTVRFAEPDPLVDARIPVELRILGGSDATVHPLTLAVDLVLPRVTSPRTRMPIRVIGIRRDG